MPETTRTEITAARQSLTRATTLAGWGMLYLAVGALWWPGLLLTVTTCGTAWRRARTAADTYALLIEAAARLHTADLARSLGLDHTGPLNQQTGWALTCLLQGRAHLIPPTTGLPVSIYLRDGQESTVHDVRSALQKIADEVGLDMIAESDA